MIFDPLRNFFVSSKTFGRFSTLKYIAILHKKCKIKICLEFFTFKGGSFGHNLSVVF